MGAKLLIFLCSASLAAALRVGGLEDIRPSIPPQNSSLPVNGTVVPVNGTALPPVNGAQVATLLLKKTSKIYFSSSFRSD